MIATQSVSSNPLALILVTVVTLAFLVTMFKKSVKMTLLIIAIALVMRFVVMRYGIGF